MSRYLAWGIAGLLVLWGSVSGPGAAWAGGGWVVYWDGSYHGQVLDAETKAPIEGAVIVAIYYESCYRFIQTNMKDIGVQEVLTDAQGQFRIPSFWTVSTPDCWYDSTGFFVFKPGYGTFPPTTSFGLHTRTNLYSPGHPELEFIQDMFKAGGTVELPRLSTEELRRFPISLPVFSDRLRKKLGEFSRLSAELDRMKGTSR